MSSITFTLGLIAEEPMLTWNFVIELQWTPDTPAADPPGLATTPSLGDLPSLFTALREQLGFKLESTKGSVDVLVIDHVQHRLRIERSSFCLASCLADVRGKRNHYAVGDVFTAT